MNTLQPFINIMADNCRWVLLDPNRARTVWWNMAIPEDRAFPDGALLLPVSNAMIFQTEVADRLLELYPAEPLAGYYFDSDNGVRRWGLRARDGFNCLEIAKQYGGNGHKRESWFIQIP